MEIVKYKGVLMTGAKAKMLEEKAKKEAKKKEVIPSKEEKPKTN
jgi:hypothetical protein